MNLYISQSVLMDHGKFLASGSTKHFLSPYEIEDVIFETLKNNPSKLLYCIPSNKRSLLSESLTKARTACLQDELGSMHKKLNTVELQAFLDSPKFKKVYPMAEPIFHSETNVKDKYAPFDILLDATVVERKPNESMLSWLGRYELIRDEKKRLIPGKCSSRIDIKKAWLQRRVGSSIVSGCNVSLTKQQADECDCLILVQMNKNEKWRAWIVLTEYIPELASKRVVKRKSIPISSKNPYSRTPKVINNPYKKRKI